MKTRHWAAWIALGLTGAAGCTGTVTPGDVGGSGTGSSGSTGSSGAGGGTCWSGEPAKHRPEAIACPPSTPTPATPEKACATDADCAPTQPGDPTGKCDASMTCDYDQCATDADCTGTQVCSCQGQSGGFGGQSLGSTCIPADCHVDADCGAGGFCSPTVSSSCGSFYGIQGYYCHACPDTCTDDSDCGNGTGVPGYCAYDPTVGHWACDYGVCAG